MRERDTLSDFDEGGKAEVAPERIVEVLYVDDCPHYAALVARLPGLADEAGVTVRIRLRCVADETAATREHFVGSPTVLVDGKDVEPGVGERSDFGVRCRLYAADARLQPIPPDRWILDALARFDPEERGVRQDLP